MPITRLEKTYYRLQAQLACFDLAFQYIANKPGLLFEIGLGLGRTYQHMKQHLPDRNFCVFERKLNCYPECQPSDNELILGDIRDTLPLKALQFQDEVIFANCDIGSFDKTNNALLATFISANLHVALARDALVMSDLELDSPYLKPLPLPDNTREGSYHLYRHTYSANTSNNSAIQGW